MISVDVNKCIGCPTCSKACPLGMITFQDGERRVIRFGRCQEDCDICVRLCPEKALLKVDEGREVQLTFAMRICSLCGSGFAPELMLDRVRSSIPPILQRDATGLCWLDICPGCRRKREGEKAAKQTLVRRS